MSQIKYSRIYYIVENYHDQYVLSLKEKLKYLCKTPNSINKKIKLRLLHHTHNFLKEQHAYSSQMGDAKTFISQKS